ncbi:PepSY domain-containing protein [Sporosarcina sp. UB5]|uniref:PepSY domain-containing protein n=1 Tax=Sporosarcina sp. UB5 TaxID=3047463 RepID=UPI003D797100
MVNMNNNNNWENNWRNPRFRRISITQAMEVALNRVPGDVIKAELEFDDGVLLYEITIRTKEGVRYEVKVDAVTGQIISSKQD